MTIAQKRQFVRHYLEARHGDETKVSFQLCGVYYTRPDGQEVCFVESGSKGTMGGIDRAVSYIANK